MMKLQTLFTKKTSKNTKALHSLLQRDDATSEEVENVLQKSPSALLNTDNEGRLAIHVAVTQTVDHSIVETLIKFAGKDAAEMCSQQDQDQKTPMHMAIESYDPRFYDFNQDLVIRTLFQAAPLSALIEDKDGRIPQEMAFLMDCEKTMLHNLNRMLRPLSNRSINPSNAFSRAA